MKDTNNETCRCKKDEGLRSTHCPIHGSCTCCHGATCPTHDEPEKFVGQRFRRMYDNKEI